MTEEGASCSTAERDRRDTPAVLADSPHWDDALLVATDGAATRPKVRSASAAAGRAGVRAGMTLAQARALCTNLEALPWDDVAVSAAITATTALFVQASPQVSPVAGAPGMWWIGASGFAAGARRNHDGREGIGSDGDPADGGGTADEHAFARALQVIAHRWHPRSRVAIAGSCVAARAATWASASFARDTGALICVVPPGGDAAYLASAPLSLLPMDGEIRDALRALGIRTVGGFADLDAGDVEQRWGDAGLVAWRLAHGDDPRRPVLARFDDQPHVEMELDAPAETMEPVLFLVRPGVESLVARLAAQARAIASLAVTLTLDDARGPLPAARPHTVTREIRLARALARAAPIFERCRGLLARWELTAPVTSVRLTALLTAPMSGEQGHLLDTSWRDPGAADAAIERLRAELGPQVIVKPHARDAFVLERSGEWREETELSAPRRSGEPARPASGTRAAAESAVRLLESPEKVDVDRDGSPRRIFWRGRAIPVVQATGPERLSGDWWNDGYHRDYWRCESDEEWGDLVVYRDPEGWWVQGWYD